MNLRITFFAVASFAMSVASHAQTLTPEEIDKAIRAGETGRHKQLITTCGAVIGFREAFKEERVGQVFTGSYEVTLAPTTGHIALLAAAAKRFYKPFALEQVPDDLKTLDTIVTAEPSQPYESSTMRGSISVAAPIELIVVKAWPNRKLVVTPAEFTTEPVEWPNVAGQTLRGNRARARFRTGEILELPPGDLEIAVVTPAGERTCSIAARDRKRVFGR
jgi:hypothetical protein